MDHEHWYNFSLLFDAEIEIVFKDTIACYYAVVLMGLSHHQFLNWQKCVYSCLLQCVEKYNGVALIFNNEDDTLLYWRIDFEKGQKTVKRFVISTSCL